MDAITLLKNDHKTVEKLFKQFEQAGDNAFATKRKLMDQIIEELSKHAAIEEQLFYPVTRETVPETNDIALESLEEHHVVKWLLDELEHMDPTEERFTPKATVLIENVRHHVEEEEEDYFPKVRDELGRNALTDLGDAMEKLKEVAPTHPHPRTPDTPPANFVVGTAAGVVDRVTDTVSGAAQGSLNAAQDLIARITGRPKPRRAAPTGSPTARKTAEKVRASADAAATKAERTGKATTTSAVRGAKETVKAATAGAKRTTSTAKGAANRTTSTAKGAATQTAGAAKAGAKRTTSTAKGAAKRTTSTAKGAATQTAGAAKAGAKRTTSTAKGAAKRTTSTAKGAATQTANTAKRAAKRTSTTAKRTASTPA